jgi:hypothetical protein
MMAHQGPRDETWVEPLFPDERPGMETYLIIAAGDAGLTIESHYDRLIAWAPDPATWETDLLDLDDPDTVAALPTHLRHALARHVAEVAVRLGLTAHRALCYHARLTA